MTQGHSMQQHLINLALAYIVTAFILDKYRVEIGALTNPLRKHGQDKRK